MDDYQACCLKLSSGMALLDLLDCFLQVYPAAFECDSKSRCKSEESLLARFDLLHHLKLNYYPALAVYSDL